MNGTEHRQRNAAAGWLLFGLIALATVAAVAVELGRQPAGEGLALFELLLVLVPLVFALVGALIISRQPRNAVGLLMMLPGLSLVPLVDTYIQPYVTGATPIPQPPTPLFLLVLWFSNWNWLLLVFPLMLIMVVFPTGRPLNRRWGWLVYAGYVLAAVVILTSTFTQTLTDESGLADWSVRNPIGFVPDALAESVVQFFSIGLPVWALLCAASLFVRFRRAREVERNQIKWLFYAVALFTAAFIPTVLLEAFSDEDSLWNILWLLGMLTIPIAVAIAILRYRLFDIDVIIRKTLVYAVLTGLLALLYFGTIVLLQSSIGSLAGGESPLVIVISTLLIAAVFTPLRRRVQNVIDRRFYRQKFNAEQLLSRFAVRARDETDVEALTAEMARIVEEAVRPAGIHVWLAAGRPEVITLNDKL